MTIKQKKEALRDAASKWLARSSYCVDGVYY